MRLGQYNEFFKCIMDNCTGVNLEEYFGENFNQNTIKNQEQLDKFLDGVKKTNIDKFINECKLCEKFVIDHKSDKRFKKTSIVKAKQIMINDINLEEWSDNLEEWDEYEWENDHKDELTQDDELKSKIGEIITNSHIKKQNILNAILMKKKEKAEIIDIIKSIQTTYDNDIMRRNALLKLIRRSEEGDMTNITLHNDRIIIVNQLNEELKYYDTLIDKRKYLGQCIHDLLKKKNFEISKNEYDKTVRIQNITSQYENLMSFRTKLNTTKEFLDFSIIEKNKNTIIKVPINITFEEFSKFIKFKFDIEYEFKLLDYTKKEIFEIPLNRETIYINYK